MARLIDDLKSKLRVWLSIPENDNTFMIGSTSLNDLERDRPSYSRAEILEQCLDAWRYNPLARRIIELTTQYTIGNGIEVSSKNKRVNDFIQEFWGHYLNKMDSRLLAMSDELARAGNLFILISTDPSGMSFIREVQADQVEEILTARNDIEQETGFKVKNEEGFEPFIYQAYDPTEDDADDRGNFAPIMVHYSVNRPAGGLWGESDLSHLLKWLARYTAWLEDRVRLNRFRNAFLYVVKASFINEASRKARQTELLVNPPTPGSILVTDETEEWSVLTPKLEALDASTDGIALKKMVAAGAGIPMHFLAEPESATRTTAEAAGGPTYRKYEQRQQVFLWIIRDLVQIALNRRALVDYRLNPDEGFDVQAADISARDNVALAMAGNQIKTVVLDLYDMGIVDHEEVLRLVYKFTGEAIDIEEMIKRGTGIDRRDVVTKPRFEEQAKIDPETGDLKGTNG